jgi:hypothetical protein
MKEGEDIVGRGHRIKLWTKRSSWSCRFFGGLSPLCRSATRSDDQGTRYNRKEKKEAIDELGKESGGVSREGRWGEFKKVIEEVASWQKVGRTQGWLL